MNQGLVAVVFEPVVAVVFELVVTVETKIVASASAVDAMESASSNRLPAAQALCQVFSETRFHPR
jgi:hypothetical protein